MSIKKWILKILHVSLLVWGVTSLIGIICIGGYFAYVTGPGNKTVIDKANKSDVRFVLNWCKLGEKRIEKVLNSHVSGRSFTGDHLDAYKIKISQVSIDELDQAKGHWYRGDSLPPILNDAIAFIGSWQDNWQDKITWFPTEANIRSSEYYIYPWSIDCHGILPNATQLIILKPSEKMVYYISTKI